MRVRMIVKTMAVRQILLVFALTFAAISSCSAAPSRLRLDDGMPLIVVPVNEISSARANAGDPVTFTVAHRCKVNGVVLVEVGTIVHGVVVKARHSQMFSKPGVLEVSFDSTKAIDGSPLRLRAALSRKGNLEKDTAAKLATVLPYGIGLAFNGREAVLRTTVPLTIFVDENAEFLVDRGKVLRRLPAPAK